MDIRVLKYFLAVAQEENISRAAEVLHMTQPNLSRQMRELEAELDTKLMIRGSRRITLTQEGVLLRRRAGELIELFEKTRAEFRETEESITGDIYIGAGETEAVTLLAQVAKRLQTEHPHITYHIFSGNEEDVTERLDKGLLDFGILIEPADIKKYDYIKLPIVDQWGLLMRKGSPLAEKDVVTPDDIASLPLIVSRQSMEQNQWKNWFQRDTGTLDIVSTYNLLYNASLMVREGLGYALCLDKLINTTGDSQLCFRPLKPKLTVGLDVVWKKYQVFSKASSKFLELLQEEL